MALTLLVTQRYLKAEREALHDARRPLSKLARKLFRYYRGCAPTGWVIDAADTRTRVVAKAIGVRRTTLTALHAELEDERVIERSNDVPWRPRGASQARAVRIRPYTKWRKPGALRVFPPVESEAARRLEALRARRSS